MAKVARARRGGGGDHGGTLTLLFVVVVYQPCLDVGAEGPLARSWAGIVFRRKGSQRAESPVAKTSSRQNIQASKKKKKQSELTYPQYTGRNNMVHTYMALLPFPSPGPSLTRRRTCITLAQRATLFAHLPRQNTRSLHLSPITKKTRAQQLLGWGGIRMAAGLLAGPSGPGRLVIGEEREREEV